MSIIDDKKYNKFIKENIYLTKCQADVLIDLRTKLNTFYKPVNSDSQVITFLNKCLSESDFLQEAKLKIMLNNFTPKTNVKNIIHKLKNRTIQKDSDIIKLILNYKGPADKKKKEICSPWEYILLNMAKTSLKLFKDFGFKQPIRYLDIGCGRGNKTLRFGKNIGLKPKEIDGADIVSWGPYQQKKIEHEFNFKEIGPDGKLNYKTDTFDMITCFLMLHHVENLMELLDEIKRILKPNGLILIIEHDNHDDYDNMLVDILHTFYGLIVDKKQDSITKPIYSQYYNWAEWDYVFDLKGFKYVSSNYLFKSVTHDVRYDNIYYTFYQNDK